MEQGFQHLNLHAWNAMTHEWERAQRQNKQVKVDIQIVYAPAGERVPVVLDIRSAVDDLIYHHTFRVGRPTGVVEDDLSGVPDAMLYQKVQDGIAEAAGDSWRKAALYAEISEDDYGLVYGRAYPSSATSAPISFETDYRMYLLLDEVRTRMHKPGQDPWVKVTCILHRDGAFDLEFEYPDRGNTRSATS
jgi:hypothetical protein